MKKVLLISVALVVLGGCTGYRMTSNVVPSSADRDAGDYPVTITEGNLDVPYEEIGPLEVVIRPASVFNEAPTQRHARLGLMQKARAMGATAVIHVTYEEEFDIISFGHIEARGVAVKVK
ncbi:MAG: hypothetical protein VYA55_22115 [Pseudomonadota bacterium]|nr:hypothetical protein [Pseudomonadota bacterium]